MPIFRKSSCPGNPLPSSTHVVGRLVSGLDWLRSGLDCLEQMSQCGRKNRFPVKDIIAVRSGHWCLVHLPWGAPACFPTVRNNFSPRFFRWLAMQYSFVATGKVTVLASLPVIPVWKLGLSLSLITSRSIVVQCVAFCFFLSTTSPPTLCSASALWEELMNKGHKGTYESNMSSLQPEQGGLSSRTHLLLCNNMS